MGQQRYTAEFKHEAVRQVIERKHPVQEVADRLGVSSRRASTKILEMRSCLSLDTALPGAVNCALCASIHETLPSLRLM